MPLGKIIKIDVKTGKEEIVEEMFPEPEPYVERKGIDFAKLKNVLLQRGIISSMEEVE